MWDMSFHLLELEYGKHNLPLTQTWKGPTSRLDSEAALKRTRHLALLVGEPFYRLCLVTITKYALSLSNRQPGLMMPV